MNCRECLEELSTGSLRDLTVDSEVARHAITCPDCGPLLTQLRDREYQAAAVLNGLPPLDNPVVVAETAGRLAHRRRIGRIAVTISAIALGLTIWFAADTMIIDVGGIGLNQVAVQHTETVPLTCLSPEQAGSMVQPYLRSHGSTWSVAPGVAAITLRATASELAQVRTVLRNFDNARSSTCQVSAPAILNQLQKQLSKITEDQRKALEAAEGTSPTPVLAGEKASTPKKKTP